MQLNIFLPVVKLTYLLLTTG